MRRSYIIASLIILLGAIISWPEWQKFTRTKEKNEQLVKAAPSLSSTQHKERSQKNRRDSRDTASTKDGKALARELIHIARLSKDHKNAQNPSETYSDKRETVIYSHLYDLTPSQIKSFFQEFYLNADPSLFSERDISEKTKVFMQIFAEKYATEMIDLLVNSPEIFKNDTDKIHDYQWNIIYDKAHEKNDPATAFQCLALLEPSMQTKYISTIINAVNTPKKRTEALEAMRTYATTPEQKKLVLHHLSDLALGDGKFKLEFAETSTWLKSAALSTEELSAATMNIEKKVQTGDIARWLDWVSSSELPDEVSQLRAFSLAHEWTKKDYQAVANWLNNAPDGPEKHAAIGAYVINTYPHDPENSMKWVKTLPEGYQRKMTIKNIYGMIPKDSDAAKAFAREHGLGQ